MAIDLVNKTRFQRAQEIFKKPCIIKTEEYSTWRDNYDRSWIRIHYGDFTF